MRQSLNNNNRPESRLSSSRRSTRHQQLTMQQQQQREPLIDPHEHFSAVKQAREEDWVLKPKKGALEVKKTQLLETPATQTSKPCGAETMRVGGSGVSH